MNQILFNSILGIFKNIQIKVLLDKEESYGFGYPLLKLQIESSHFKQPKLTANQIKKIHM